MIHFTFAFRSGAARYVYSLVDAVGTSGEQVTFVCPSEFEFLSEMRHTNVQLIPDLPRFAGRSKLKLLASMFYGTFIAIMLLLRLRNKHNLLHANFVGLSVFTIPLLAAARMARYRVVFTVHDVLPHKWYLPARLQWFEKWLLRLLYRCPEALVVLHPNAGEILQREFGILTERIHVIPHGTFSVETSPLPMSVTPEITALLFGGIRANKGIHLAISAVQQLRSEGTALRLRICGTPLSIERLYWEQCKAQIAANPDGIEVRDEYIPSVELGMEMSKCHFLLLPYTEFNSQSGVASLALSNGRAIVATRAGGLRELMSPETGIAIEQASVEGVIRALRAAVDLKEDGLALLGKTAFASFTNRYSWPAIAAMHLEMYAKLDHPAEQFVTTS